MPTVYWWHWAGAATDVGTRWHEGMAGVVLHGAPHAGFIRRDDIVNLESQFSALTKIPER